MHLGLDVAAALVHVQLHADVAVVLQREEEVVGVLDDDRAVLLDVAGVDRPGALAADVEDRVVHVVGQHQGERLEPLHDLVDVLQHALDGLVLVHHAVEAEAPDRAAAQRGEEQAAERVAQGVAEATLQRLEAELGGVGVVVPLRHLDEMRANQSSQINGHGHFVSRERLDPALLRRAAAVVRDRGHVADRHDPEPDRGERLDGGLAAAARTLHPHVHPPQPEVHGLAAAVLGGDGGGERGGLLGALEARPCPPTPTRACCPACR